MSGNDVLSLLAWNLDPTKWSQAACDVAGRNLTRPEWDTYIGKLEPYHAICPQFGDTTT